jgi:uncharacterized protein with HEPN domain
MPPEGRAPELLADIVERCDEVGLAVAGREEDEFVDDVVARNAVLYPLVIIGEAPRGSHQSSATAIRRSRGRR